MSVNCFNCRDYMEQNLILKQELAEARADNEKLLQINAQVYLDLAGAFLQRDSIADELTSAKAEIDRLSAYMKEPMALALIKSSERNQQYLDQIAELKSAIEDARNNISCSFQYAFADISKQMLYKVRDDLNKALELTPPDQKE